MKKTKLILGIIIILIISSCSPNENDSELIKNEKLVKREYVRDNYNIEYRYNDKNLLTKISILGESINSQETFIYDSNNNIIEINYSSSSLNKSYTYDNLQRLTKAILINLPGFNKTKTQTFTYNDNIIKVYESSDNGESLIYELETNEAGLINKMSNDSFTSKLIYDSKGNISEIETFNKNNTLLNTVNLIYDNKINPFYGQLKSIYIIKFLQALSDANYGEFVFDGYEGYFFPFSKNNIVTKILKGNTPRNNLYSYDNDNYPLNFKIENTDFECDIEYY
jgi:hypothetical protein